MTDQPVVAMLAAALMAFLGAFIAEPLLRALGRMFGIYAVVEERRCRVYVLFGKVIGILDEPGLNFLPAKLGPAAFFVNFLGNCYVLDLRLDQEYLRSQPVKARRWESASGMRCGSAIPSLIYLKIPIRAAPFAPT